MANSVIRLSNGVELNASEWLHQPRFSTCEFDQAASINLKLFNYVRGGIVSSVGLPKRSATELDTNVVKRKAMAQDEALIVFAITFDIYGLSEADFYTPNTGSPALVPEYSALNLRRLQRDLVVELRVGANIRKPQIGVPFAEVSQSLGPVGYATGVGATETLDQGTSGRVSGRNQRTFDLPIFIGGFGQDAVPGNAMKFDLTLLCPRGPVDDLNQNTRIRILLDGLTKSPF